MRDSGGLLEVSLVDVTLGEAEASRHPSLRVGDYVQLTVTDSGIGMTEEVQARIFEPFFTTRAQSGGTGLGLSVVHGIVESREGAVTVQSAPGRGTTFQVLLPAAAQSLKAGERDRPQARPGNERVLFVDDEKAITRMAEIGLTRLGYRVTTFTDPAAALAAFRARPTDFDLVVTDVTMPGLPGDVLVEHLRAVRPDIPVIFATGYSDRLSPESVARLGRALLTDKPLAATALSALIRTLRDATPTG
jgi:CheY-like chemotaxis protein